MYNNGFNKIFKELAELTRMKEALQQEIDILTDEIKKYMIDNNIEALEADEHRATYTDVTSNRFDSTAFKKVNELLYNEFLKSSTTKRFVFK